MPIQTRRGAARFANASASLFLLAEALSRVGPARPGSETAKAEVFRSNSQTPVSSPSPASPNSLIPYSAYPAGDDNAATFCSMLPKSRRVR
jgi:hypothetical protein